jgi:hypothetical protein
MTEPFDEYGDRLSRVLHTEAEAVVPSPEGLERIRAKIDRRRERLWYLRPWLRPLAAVCAAIVMSIITVPATAAFKNFVQTGHFSPPSNHDGGGRTVSGRHTQYQPPPGGPTPSDTRFSPRPSSDLSTSPGTDIVTGTCPPGEDKVTPSRTTSESPSPSSSPTSPEPSDSAGRVTCRPGTSTSSPSTHTPGTPTDSGTPQPPASEPPTHVSQPSVQSSP